MLKRLVSLIALLLISLSLQPSVHAEYREPVKLVGEATLKKLFWTIYDSRLYTPSGTYQGIEPNLELEIAYQRTISSSQLISSTRDEWQALSLYQQIPSEIWLRQLEMIWPNVKKGDVIKLRVDPQISSDFYFNGKAIGSIKDAAFTRQFLAIWLSPKSQYPELRLQLTGAKNSM